MDDIRKLELWGGIEGTVNRIGDRYMDQLFLTGHEFREEDIDLLAELGIEKLRYPILWERTAPQGMASADWSWPDRQLKRIRDVGITPVVGLVHHGSGPSHTQLDHDSFPHGLTAFARAVAERYPWVEYYCPVNEPLTTARFSGLYGHWYPHARDGYVFSKALLNQCRAVILAMTAIRDVNPRAKLIQTEDLGKTYSTTRLAYQADFENERRWVTFDLLTGRLNATSTMWHYFHSMGIREEELRWFQDHPCAPDTLGINHYIVSERVLDDRLYLYPAGMHGGNGRDAYVDVEAVRVRGINLAGWNGLLREAWSRFGLPLAMTEVHLNCHREDQVRWLLEAWDTANRLRSDGIDVRAVTAWSLLGSYNWHNLLTSDTGRYEPGAFELTNSRPRPTAVAHTLKRLRSESVKPLPFANRSPWWCDADRFVYPALPGAQPRSEDPVGSKGQDPRILILGRRGKLGGAFCRICRERRLPFTALSRSELDVTDETGIESHLANGHYWAVVNAAGVVDVDEAERNPINCFRVNTIGAKNLAKSCARRNVQLLTFSTDLVFDGRNSLPYIEDDTTAPLSIYGHSKAAAERRVLHSYPDALVVRAGALFGPWDDRNLLTASLANLEKQLPVDVADDWIISPTYIPHLVHRCLDLLIDGATGRWHVANETAIAWSDFIERGAAVTGVDALLLRRCRSSDLGWAARRPTFSALASSLGRLLPSLDVAMEDYRCTTSKQVGRSPRSDASLPRA